ncbi:hypothetical protein Q5741_02735 [Paenibacillus sp. JX-17]|uniref:Uncharacterized protein n=1 Tax=Paenibacillus lacisoli TaxID=3064525 RepID=A0ABT9C7U4_9BACL|nr:hypothetical protein [Paenibacillus sp. JX-17]MDO7905328.1 hypothetical protein [Paenibacillus sp. JX-17]
MQSIVIVASTDAKKEIQMQGFQRVFTVSEVQGLQYKKVYCQDILQWFTNGDHKPSKLNRTHFHQMYVAASRTSQHIYFFESHGIKSSLMDYFTSCDYVDLVGRDNNITTSVEWLQEARKLELLGKFEQALDAYKKAEDLDGVSRCQAILLREKNYGHLEEYLTIIRFDFDLQKPKQIEMALQLFKSQQLQLMGRITYFVTEYGGNIRFNPFFIEPGMTMEQISKELFSRINYDYAMKCTLQIAGVFYQENEPIRLSEKFKRIQDDLILYLKDGGIRYQLTNLTDSRYKLKGYIEFEKQKQPKVKEALLGFNVNVVIENAQKKETAEDFLSDFFGD